MMMNEYASKKYIEIPVREDTILIDFLLKQMGLTHTRVKNLLSGGAVTVNRKAVTNKRINNRFMFFVFIMTQKIQKVTVSWIFFESCVSLLSIANATN